ncbi:hypothetical protein BKA66DRAFT_463078 [Pyrenochaeta sp. MPI-SDFR-AT-0127]|nr:hypothetical protein BKA66DRAFT_463078 [Pyrenochaeta sp. MPI-SDFR-AT-0127]
MSAPSGRLAGEMKWLVARYPKPPGSMIKLGSILTDSKEPESSLNLESKEGIKDVPNARDESVAVRATITSELSSNLNALLEVKIPGNPIVDAAVKIQADKSKSVETVVDAMNVRAEIFLPSEEYMDAALANPAIVNYMKGGPLPFSKRVYVIVGVATAEKLDLQERLKKNTSASMSAGASASGDTAKAEGAVSGGNQGSMDIHRQIDVDCDFAYRVREFVYSKMPLAKGKWVKGNDVTEGTMFGDGRETRDKKDTVEEEEIPKFDNLKKKDETPEGMYVLSV